MVNIKRKKKSRQRGSHTHGCGSKKKRRGAGNRGGRGNAGTGKRGDAKKPSVWGNKKYFGKYGFSSRRPKINSINVKDLIVLSEGKKELNLKKLGYDKLLGSGKISEPLNVSVEKATQKAIAKVEAAGGKVILISKDKKEESKEKPKEEKPASKKETKQKSQK